MPGRARPLLGVMRTLWAALGMSAYSQFRTLTLTQEAEHWTLTTLRENLVKIGAKVVSHPSHPSAISGWYSTVINSH